MHNFISLSKVLLGFIRSLYKSGRRSTRGMILRYQLALEVELLIGLTVGIPRYTDVFGIIEHCFRPVSACHGGWVSLRKDGCPPCGLWMQNQKYQCPWCISLHGYSDELRVFSPKYRSYEAIANPFEHYGFRWPLHPPCTDRICSSGKSLRQLQETDQLRARLRRSPSRSHSFHWLISFRIADIEINSGIQAVIFYDYYTLQSTKCQDIFK